MKGWDEIDAILVPILPPNTKYIKGKMPLQIIQIPIEMEIYNKYSQFVQKGLAIPYTE